jgi:hypothetical protein
VLQTKKVFLIAWMFLLSLTSTETQIVSALKEYDACKSAAEMCYGAFEVITNQYNCISSV